jgi:hypothetical protein
MKPAIPLAIIAILIVLIVVFFPIGGLSTTTSQSQSSSLQTTTGQQSVESTSSTSATVSAATSSTTTNASTPCLLLIPADAQTSEFANSTFNGSVVTYSNGTRAFFSYYSCPQPVRDVESDSSLYAVGDDSPFDPYSMLSAAESNSTFIAAENGTQLIPDGGGGVDGCDYGGLENSYCTFEATFFHYSDNETLATCTGVYQRLVLTGIEVDFRTTGYLQYGVWTSEGFDLQNPIIHVMSAFEIMLYNSPQCE